MLTFPRLSDIIILNLERGVIRMAIIQQYHKDTDTTYVYESESYWVPELGQSRSRRKCIGRLTQQPARSFPAGNGGQRRRCRRFRPKRWTAKNTNGFAQNMSSLWPKQRSFG